jgi:hypothetical protein
LRRNSRIYENTSDLSHFNKKQLTTQDKTRQDKTRQDKIKQKAIFVSTVGHWGARKRFFRIPIRRIAHFGVVMDGGSYSNRQ